MKKIKAILIDVYNRKVEEIEFEQPLEAFWKCLNCRWVTNSQLNENHDVIVDYEGKMKFPEHFFSINNWRRPTFAGNGIIVGFNERGEWISNSMNIEEVKKSVIFFKLKEDENGEKIMIATPAK